jgi:O-antigen ligase
VPLLGVAALLILISLPISGARASSAAGALLALVVAIRLLPRRVTTGRRSLVAGISAAVAIGLLAAMTFFFARNPADFMARKTAAQFADLRTGGIGDARLPVYRETWKLFLRQPVFGWGWHSYRYAFRRVQEYEFKMQTEQQEKSVLLDAHNDWLQLLAELGLVGAALSAATFVGLARIASRGWWRLSPSFEILAGLGCLGLLACVDFPFACPAIIVTAWTLLAVGAGIACDREWRQARAE